MQSLGLSTKRGDRIVFTKLIRDSGLFCSNVGVGVHHRHMVHYVLFDLPLPVVKSECFFRLILRQRCGTFKLASARFTMLKRPSPRMRPLAKMMTGVSDSFL